MRCSISASSTEIAAAGIRRSLPVVSYGAMPNPVHDDPDTARTASGAYIDVGKSLELWQRYSAPQQLEREGKWVDKSTADVPIYYAFIAQDLALALDARGDRAHAEQLISDARRIVATVR